MIVCYAAVVVVVLLHQAGDITASLRWPWGIYALPKPKTGCPKEWKNNKWVENGWMQQEIKTNRHPNEKSYYLNMSGYVRSQKVNIEFCISESSKGRPAWPKGEFCIYSRNSIQGMTRGYIRLRDYYSKTFATKTCKNSFFEEQWYRHQGRWYKYSVYFQCKTDGHKKIPISLPITKPFYLLPYGSRDCQQVKWMVATTEWIEDYTYSYSYTATGKLPYHRDGNGLKMYFCYYRSCNYTLNEISGVFQSPGFPGKYPDGQLCSWRIMVPNNHTLHVHFTNFSLYKYDKDSLQFFENNSGIFEPKESLFGHYQPFNITTTRGVMFVFRSHEENNSNGFRASYTIFKTPDERTTTSKPPTTTSSPTTTTQPTTTQPPTTKQPTTKLPTTTEVTTTYPPTTNVNWTTNETVQCNPIPAKDKSSYNERHIHPLVKKTCFCDETWRIVVMVIPLAVSILIVLVIIDIVCRCRYKNALKRGAKESSANDGMVVNPTYERGNIILDQPADTSLTDTSTVNTVDEQPQSRDEPPDYEDVDYTQVDEVPPPRRSMKRQECHALQPVGNDTSAVFYHVLERPESQDQPQIHVPGPVGNGTRHTLQLELLTESGRPTYQNLSELNHYTLNPLYEAAENSPPLVEANRLYDNYIA